jgi:hypothetical protein
LGADGYRTKADLKRSVGQRLSYMETSAFGSEYTPDGKVLMVGPCAYTKRSWYASIVMENGRIKKVA